ncbi:MAG: hypothetical protein ACREU3_04915 [Steroidobacteraceae bacterium]
MRSTPARRVLAARTLVAGAALLSLSWAVIAAAPPRSTGAPEAARIEGSLTITVIGPRVKHWGVPRAEAVFVPASDTSVYAARIRSAPTARALCAALDASKGKDERIATAPIDGDGNLEHRSGDQELMTFAMSIPVGIHSTQGIHGTHGARGTLHICAAPFVAMMSNGAYPRESFYQVSSGHTLFLPAERLIVSPGKPLPVHLSADVDASRW